MLFIPWLLTTLGSSGGLHAKLLLSLQQTGDSALKEETVMSLSPDKLGVDSLVAVDIQAWFKREVAIDVPTLRILNSTSMGDVVKFALEGASQQHELKQVHGEGGEDHIAVITEDVLDAPPAPIATANTAASLTPASDPGETVASSSDDDSCSVDSFTTAKDLESDDTDGLVSPSSEPLTLEDRHSDHDGRTTKSNNTIPMRVLPMSFAQRRFWFLHLMVPDQPACHVITTCRLQGSIEVDKLERALEAVGQRHEALRTCFYTDSTTREHVQGVLPYSTLRLQRSVVHGAAEQAEQATLEAIQDMKSHRFDLESGESLLLRLLSFSDDPQLHVLVLCYHHVAMDGIGHQIFYDELQKAYNGESARDSRDTQNMLQYPDFTERQIREHSQGSWSKELAYWRNQLLLPRPPPVLPLLWRLRSTNAPRPGKLSFGSFSASIRIPVPLKLQIEQLCRQQPQGIAPFHIHLAVFNILLFRYTTGADNDVDDDDTHGDMCIGVADTGRRDADVLRSLGLFLNLLPLRLPQRSSKETFAHVLKDVKRTSDNGFANSRVPTDLIFKELNSSSSEVVRSTATSQTPLFQTLFNFRQNVQENFTFCGCDAAGEMISSGMDAYDVTIDVLNSTGGVADGDKGDIITIKVNSALYTAHDAEVLLSSYVSLLEGAVRNPAARISWLPLYRDSDVQAGIDLGRG